MNNEIKQEIDRILYTFQRVIGITVETEHPGPEDAANQHPRLRLTMPNNTQLKPFEVLYTATIDKAAVAEVTARAYKTAIHPIIATPAMTAEAGKRLREDNIPYVDGIGNAYLNERGAFVLVDQAVPNGQKARRTPAAKANETETQPRRAPTRAFKPAGLKVIFALLQDRELIQQPYRDIAKRAGVALGTIRYALTDLEELGFLQTVGKQRHLRDLGKLAQRWVEAYNERLRPKLVTHRYTTTQNLRDWTPEQLGNLPAWWGGETAGAELTDFLKPGGATIYVAGPVPPTAGRLQREFGLTRDPHGAIEILKTFWPAELDLGEKHIAPPLVVYADLIANPDARLKETADILYERHLTGHFRED